MRLSYQVHARRSEHWFIVRGAGVVTLDEAPVEVASRYGDRHRAGRLAPDREHRAGRSRARRGAARRVLRRGRHRAPRGRLRPDPLNLPIRPVCPATGRENRYRGRSTHFPVPWWRTKRDERADGWGADGRGFGKGHDARIARVRADRGARARVWFCQPGRRVGRAHSRSAPGPRPPHSPDTQRSLRA